MSAPDLVAIAALRARLCDAGYRPLAVFSHDHPDRDRAGKAPLGNAWTERARRDPPECVSLPAVAWAANTGLLCDGLRVFDFDIDDPELAGLVRAHFIATFGDDVPIRYRENSGRCAAVLRAASGSPGKRVLAGRLGKIEVLGHGQQFVAHGIHPSGAELYWYPDPPEQIARETLRAITEEEITSFLKAVAPLIEAEPEPERRTNGQDQAHDWHGDGPATAELFNIVAALTVIPNDGPADWERWNAIGMATWVASGGSEPGFAAWCAWSAKHPSHDEAACRARWQHYPTSPPTRTGAGKLYALAADAVTGWHPWPQPLDFLIDADTAPPELRQEHLPDALWGYATDTAARMGVDPVAPALGGLVSCAAVISDEWCIQPKRYDTTWLEKARLWAALVGDPSILKSPVVTDCTRPIDRLDADARARHQEEMRTYKAELAAWKADKSGPEPRHPKLARYLVENATIDALSEVLRDDDDAKQLAPGGKVLSRHDEMGEFFANLDRYRVGGRGGGDRGAYLRLYNGGRYTVDRIGRGVFVIPNWSACFLGGIQPGPVQRIAKDADDDGLLQRFMFCVPGRQDAGEDRVPDFTAIRRYEDLFPRLAALHPNSRDGGVVLHEDAHGHREDINALARAMAQLPDTSARLQAALGKWHGLFARLCLTFHLINVADARHDGQLGPHLGVVPEATARRVASFMRDILAPHLLRAEALMFATVQTGHARWIAGHILAHRMDRITSRDVVRAYGALRAPEAKDELATVMASLVTVGWLEAEMPGNPAKPISAWTVNPAVHSAFEARAEREREAREKTREAIDAHVAALRHKIHKEELA